MQKSAAAMCAAALFCVDSCWASSALGQRACVRGDLQHQKLGRGAQLEQVAVVDGNLPVLVIGGAQRARLFDNGGHATACHQHRSIGGVKAACEPCAVRKRYTQVPAGYIGTHVGDAVSVVCE